MPQLFSLFQTPLINLLRNKFELYSQLHLQDDTILNWQYWEFEQHIKFLNEKNKEENKRRKEENDQSQGMMPSMNNFNPGSMMKSAGNMKR